MELDFKIESDSFSTDTPVSAEFTSPDSNVTSEQRFLTWTNEKPGNKMVAQELLGGITFLLAVVTIFGNSVLIAVIVKTSQLRTVTNSFIVSLAVSDLVVGLLVMPFCGAAAFGSSWPFTGDFCSITGFLSSTCSTATLLNLMMVSIDRCIAVSWPLKYSIVMTFPVASCMLGYVWLHSLVFSLMPFMGWGSFDYILDIFTCSYLWHEDLTYVLTRNIMCIVVPSLVIAAMFVIILKSAHAQRRIFAIMPMPMGLAAMAVRAAPTAVNYRRTTLQAMRTLFIIVGILGTLWLPYTVIKLVEYKERIVSPLTVTSFAWISLLSSTVNPIIFLTNRKFNQRFKEIICRWRHWHSSRVSPHELTQNTQSTSLNSVYDSQSGASVIIQPRLIPVVDLKASTLMVPKMVSSIPPGSPGAKRLPKRKSSINLSIA